MIKQFSGCSEKIADKMYHFFCDPSSEINDCKIFLATCMGEVQIIENNQKVMKAQALEAEELKKKQEEAAEKLKQDTTETQNV